MKLSEYQKAYNAAPVGKKKAEAHRQLIGAERALAVSTAPIYYARMGEPGNSLVTTGEYDAYYAAFGTVELSEDEVLRLAPPR